MAGIFTRGELDKIIRNSELTEEQKTEQLFSLYGRALDDGYISKRAAEEAKQAALEAAKADFKPEPIDPRTTPEYQDLLRERDMLRAIGGEEFAAVKPKFREQVFGMLDRGEKAKPISEQLTGIAEKYEEYFAAKETAPKPTFGAPTQGSMPKGEDGAESQFLKAWGITPKR
jgi:hypothetical protein